MWFLNILGGWVLLLNVIKFIMYANDKNKIGLGLGLDLDALATIIFVLSALAIIN